MRTRDKFRLKQIAERCSATPDIFGCMQGTFNITGDVVGSEWDEPHDPSHGIDYRLEYGEPYVEVTSKTSETQNA